METAENGYEGDENGAEGYDDGSASAALQAEAGDGENNGAGEGVQDGDGCRIEASKSEEDAGYVSLKPKQLSGSILEPLVFCSFLRLLLAPCVSLSQGDGRARARQRVDSSLPGIVAKESIRNRFGLDLHTKGGFCIS